MKNISFKLIGSVLLLGMFLLVSSDCIGQAKGTKVRQTTATGDTGGFLSITKSYEFDSGGLTIKAFSTNVDYTVYERPSRDADWVKTDAGTIKVKDNQQIDICQVSKVQVKVDVKLSCDDCTDIRRITCN